MVDTMIKCSVGVRLKNWQSSLDDPTGTGSIGGADYLGPLYDSDASTYSGLEILKVTKPTDVSISDVGPMQETFQTTEDAFEYDITIRDVGGCSFEIYDTVDTTNGTASMGLFWGSKNLPRGCTNTSSGSAVYSAFDDNPGTESTDRVGYEVLLEWQISASVFRYIKFSGCKLKAIPTPSPGRATKLRVDFTDARYVSTGTTTSTQLVTS